MNPESAQDFTAGGRWQHQPRGLFRLNDAKAAKAPETRLPRELSVAAAAPALGAARGLWLDGPRSAEDIAALAALPELRELHFKAASREALEALVALSTQRSLECVRLWTVPASWLATLAGLRVERLALTVTGEAEGSGEGLTALFGLLVRELRVKADRADPLALPIEAARALTTGARIAELYLEGLVLDAATVQALLSAPTATSVTLHKFGAPGTLVVSDNPSVRRLELVGTNFDALELTGCRALEHLRVFRCDTMRLTDLPSLRFFEAPPTHPLEVTLRDLPRLEHIYGPGAMPTKLAIDGVPMLRAVELDGGHLDGESKASLAQTGARLRLEDRAYEPRKRAGDKRKLKKGDWKNPQLGAGEAFGVLIAARVALHGVAEARAKEIGVACEHWAQKLGRHVAGVLPLDLSQNLSYARCGPVFVGEVVGLVGPGAPKATVDAAAVRAAVRDLAQLGDDFWNEACGVLGTAALMESSPGLFLVATGGSARASLLRAGAPVTWVDVDVVPWTAVDLDALDGEVTLEHGSTGTGGR